MRLDWFSCFDQKGSADHGGNRRRNTDRGVSGERGMNERPPLNGEYLLWADTLAPAEPAHLASGARIGRVGAEACNGLVVMSEM